VTPSRAVVRIGTRGSTLALAQATIVGAALEQAGVGNEIVVIETDGDRRAPDTAWGEGAFVTAIERALVENRVDAAVHSAKDMPTDEDPRLRIAAYLTRDEPRDALVLPAGSDGSIDTMPPGTVIGTDSPRRTGFLRAYRADLEIRPLHGNVDTRLRRLDEGAVGALVLAAAGLIRLARGDRISQLLPIDVVPPSPGQGAIAVQVRARDCALGELLGRIDDRATRLSVEAERAFLRAGGGGCRAPIGALATLDGDRLQLFGGFATVDGRSAGFEAISGSGHDGLALARTLAARLTARRARLPGAPRVLITRPAADGSRLAARLAEHGLGGVMVPAIEIEPADELELAEALGRLRDFDWVVATSANGARAVGSVTAPLAISSSTARWAAVGRASASELIALGVRDVWLPSESNAAALAEQLPVAAGQQILWARGDLADDLLIERLHERGAEVRAITVYRTREAPPASRRLLAEALAGGPIDAVLLASPSAVRGLLALTDGVDRAAVLAAPAICVGPRTTAAARSAGFDIIAEAATQDAAALAELTAHLLAQARPMGQSTGVPR